MGGLHSTCGSSDIVPYEKNIHKIESIRSSKAGSADSKRPNRSTSTFSFPQFKMSEDKKIIIQKHFRATVKEQRPDIFHKTMLLCIQSSPKLNEIIACQMYCFRDLTKWPKLNKLSQAQFDFFERIIHEHNLDSLVVSEASYQLGVIHARYAEYGLKPHFLDLWRQHFETLLGKLVFEKPEEKTEFFEAFQELMRYVTETLNLSYSRCQQQAALMKSKEKITVPP
uniref:GLOBIN domain-containing protein n=1 Tax=Haemonchus contortus TaxID=6289 RepID=A0A7I4Z509_HAECO